MSRQALSRFRVCIIQALMALLIFVGNSIYAQTLIGTVNVGSQPGGVAVNPTTNRIYVANEQNHSLSIIDGGTNAVFNTVEGIGYPRYVALNPNTNLIYTTSFLNDVVYFVNGITDQISGVNIPGPLGIAVNPNTNRIYIASQTTALVFVIDGNNHQIIVTVPVGEPPSSVAVNPNTNRIYVGRPSSQTVAVIDEVQQGVINSISLAGAPGEIGVNPNTNSIYVALPATRKVLVIDGGTNTIISAVDVGNSPIGIAVDATANRIYVANSSDRTVSIIDGTTNTVAATVPLAVTPGVVGANNGIGVNPIKHLVYISHQQADLVSVVEDPPSAPPPPIVSFTNATATAGVNAPGSPIGVAWGDYDNDGDLDLYVAGSGANRLYKNNGDGTFTNVATSAGVNDGGNGIGVAWGDYDNDGDLDLYLVNSGSANRFYQNNGNGTFADIAAVAGVKNSAIGNSVAWGDYNNDGYLDLYVVNSGSANLLYRNSGPPNFTFTDVGASAGVDNGNGVQGCWGDYDNDGDLDLYVVKSGSPNLLYQNSGPPNFTFTDVGASAGVDNLGGNSAAWGDYNNDGFLDLYVGAGSPSRLYQNNGNGTFTEVGASAGVSNPNVLSRGIAWGDYDNDGDLDLFVANTGAASRLYKNSGSPTFTFVDDASSAGVNFGAGSNDNGHGLAWGDYDNDGDLDLFVANPSASPSWLYQNNGTTNRWLVVKLIGTISNKSGIGARVTVVTGSTRRYRDVEGSSGFYSQPSLPVEFGFGSTTTVDELSIRWPSGQVQTLTNVATNQIMTITEPVGSPPTIVSIAVTPPSPTIAMGQTQQFTATATLSDGSTPNITATATWTSSNPAVATIAAGGLATAASQGTTQITASKDGVPSPAQTLTVNPITPTISSIAVTPTSPTIAVGQTQQFTATATLSDGSTPDITATATWASSNPAVATIAAGGLATAVGEGTTQITASKDGVPSPAQTLTVNPITLTIISIAVTPPSPTIAMGQTQQFTATATLSNGSTQNINATATWTSSAPTVATIATGGLATAVGEGTTQIRASKDGVASPARTLTVSPPSSSRLLFFNAFAAPGGQAIVEVRLNTDQAVAALQLTIQPRLNGAPTTAAQFSGLINFVENLDFTPFPETDATGTTRIALVNTSGGAIPAGERRILHLIYTIAPGTATGTVFDLAVTNTVLSSTALAAIPHALEVGQIYIGRPGDLAGGPAGDGQVDIIDVLKVIYLVVGRLPMPEPGMFEFFIADVNGDGAINILDAVAIIYQIIAPPTKPFADGPTAPVTVSLGEVQAQASGQLAIPVTLQTDGVVAGLQAEVTFDPTQLQLGAPQLVGRAEGMTVVSQMTDGTLRLVMYSVTGQGIRAGQGTTVFIPVTVRGGPNTASMLTLSQVVLANRQAQAVPVILGTSAVKVAPLPTAFALKANRPNPFNPTTQIAYEVPQTAHVTLGVYNMLGQEVIRLVDAPHTPGRYEVTWDGRNAHGAGVASGVYLYRLTTSTGFNQTRRMTLVK